MKKILSIDGGGIRGIIPGQILVALEEKLQQRSGRKDARIVDYFDFIAGTSTGGILACLLLCPDHYQPGKARFSAQAALNLYLKHGHKIFDPTHFSSDELHGLYDVSSFEELLESYFGNLRLSQLLKPCLIPAFDLQKKEPFLFMQQVASSKEGNTMDFYVRDVCRATSAAPTYFKPAEVRSVMGNPYTLMDGGVFANNPSLLAFAEARQFFSLHEDQEMFFVSLGTGSQISSLATPGIKYAQLATVEDSGNEKVDINFDSTEQEMRNLYAKLKQERHYFRIQPAHLGKASLAPDDASQSNLKSLMDIGCETANDFDCQLNEVVDTLLR